MGAVRTFVIFTKSYIIKNMEGNPWSEFRIFIGIVILLWIAWFITGGPERYDKSKPYIEPPKGPGTVTPTGPGFNLFN